MTLAATDTDDPLGEYRTELRAHCYRMLGSFHDAEDVLQEVSVKAWRGAAGFEGRSSRRTWLHTIATNACLSELDRKERRVVPVEFSPESTPEAGFDDLRHEVPWLEPYPSGDPQASAETTEHVELAFVAAVQHLPPNQRAALLMFEVLNFSAQEIAEAMGTTPQSVNSALQRARATLASKVPATTQQQTLQQLGDDAQRRLVAGYTKAIRTHDVDGMLALLTEDATWSMPPMSNWYRGSEAIAGFLAKGPFSVEWRHRLTTANGQICSAGYAWDEESQEFRAYALDVLTIAPDGRISEVYAFLDGTRFRQFGLPATVAG